MIKAVIFDMDGVIVDSEPIHFEIEKSLIKKYSGKEVTKKDLEKFVGTTDNFFWKSVVKDFNLDIAPERISKEKNRLFLSKIKEVNLFPGVNKLIKQLKNSQIKIAFASSSKKEWIKRILDYHNLCFDVVISGETLTNPKPAPDIFLETAKRLGINPEDCLVIEDAVNGVKAANSAGMLCLAITNTFLSAKVNEADYIINNLNEFNYDWLR